MDNLFLHIVNMSITASWIVLAVVAIRFLFKNAPKWLRVVLWGLVGVRLILPFSFESILSLIPSAETVPQDIVYAEEPKIYSGVSVLNSTINPILSESLAPEAGASVNPVQILLFVASLIWLFGIAIMLIYTAASYIKIRMRVRESVLIDKNIYVCDRVDSPFILGVVRPRIYLSSSMIESDMQYVIAHEKEHIKRGDHIIKPLAFLLLSVYWFNPLLWIAYILLCRDIELACDERVISKMGEDNKKPYSDALINCSVPRRFIAACPLAFGEVGVKERVKSVLNYKKPAFWVIIAAVVVSIVAAVCLLTNPMPSREFAMSGTNVSDLDVEYIVEHIKEIQRIENEHLYVNEDLSHVRVDSNFDFISLPMIRYFFFQGKDTYDALLAIEHEDGVFSVTNHTKIKDQKTMYLLDHYLMALKYLPKAEIRSMSDADHYTIDLIHGGVPDNYSNSITYSQNGAEEIDGWYIHLQLSPMYGWVTFGSNGEEPIHLFFGDSPDSVPDEGSELTDDSVVSELYEKYPQYFGLDASNGLDVIVWQMAENSYSFGLLPHQDSPREWLSHELLNLKGARVNDMRDIIATYDLSKDDIHIILWQNPISSYLGEYQIMFEGEDQKDVEKRQAEFIEMVEGMLFGEQIEESTITYPIYDTLIFDVDDDGRAEHCTLQYGRTSGVFTFVFTAREIAESELEYSTVFYSAWYDLSFKKCDDGVVRVQGIDQNDPPGTHLFDISVIDGNISLTENGIEIGKLEKIIFYSEAAAGK